MPKLGSLKLPEVSVKGFEGWVAYYILFVLVVALAFWAWTRFHKTRPHI